MTLFSRSRSTGPTPPATSAPAGVALLDAVTATTIPAGDPDDLRAQLARDKAALSSLLPVEAEAHARLSTRVAVASERLTVPSIYPTLSTEPFCWRDRKGYPRLLVLSPFDTPTMRLRHGWDFRGDIKPRLPVILEACYTDIWKGPLFAKRERYENITVTSQVSLVVPASAKQALEQAREHFYESQLFFVLEATPECWTATVEVVDPLLIGAKNHSLYLIDRFNTTTLEDYIAWEFTT